MGQSAAWYRGLVRRVPRSQALSKLAVTPDAAKVRVDLADYPL
jgi:hypothetical protein